MELEKRMLKNVSTYILYVWYDQKTGEQEQQATYSVVQKEVFARGKDAETALNANLFWLVPKIS